MFLYVFLLYIYIRRSMALGHYRAQGGPQGPGSQGPARKGPGGATKTQGGPQGPRDADTGPAHKGPARKGPVAQGPRGPTRARPTWAPGTQGQELRPSPPPSTARILSSLFENLRDKKGYKGADEIKPVALGPCKKNNTKDW